MVQRQRRSSHELLRLFFKNSKVGTVQRYGEAGPGTKASVMSATFQLEGKDFYALNGGLQFTFSPAISFFVTCETQAEVDELWEKTLCQRRKRKVRVAQGQVWRLVANCSYGSGQASRLQRPGKTKTGDAGNVDDGQDRYRSAAKDV